MATTKKTSGATTKVTRITASDDVKQAVTSEKASKKAPQKATVSEKKPKKNNPLRALGRYFKGAWVELRQVHWPTRKATWSLTLAVLAFTAFFIVLIVLLDAGFKLLFERILG